MSHRQAVAVMVLATLLWSMAGVVTRQIEMAQGLTLTFWRSAFNAAALLLILIGLRSLTGVWRGLRDGGWPLWASGVCWAVMFTAFMWALTLTTIANVLVTMAVGPLMTALLARVLLRRMLSYATLAAVLVAGLGLALMQLPGLLATSEQASGPALAVQQVGATGPAQGWGVILALAVPLAGALNWVLIRAVVERSKVAADHRQPDFLLAVWIGACLSALWSWPAASPLEATTADLAWLALLGVFQLAVPCLLAVKVATVLQPSEVALLSLLEVLFGVAWAWWGTAEQPQPLVVLGGAIVLVTLVVHERAQVRWAGSKGGAT